MISSLYIRAKTIKPSEENIALPLHDLGLVSEFLDNDTKITDRREEKMKQSLTVKNKLDFTRIKKLVLQRTTRN